MLLLKLSTNHGNGVSNRHNNADCWRRASLYTRTKGERAMQTEWFLRTLKPHNLKTLLNN